VTRDDDLIETDRQWYRQKQTEAFAQFDRTILTLASGGLAISLVFVHDVAPHPTHVEWLVTSWSCFALSLLVILASFVTSQLALGEGFRDPESVSSTWSTATWVLNVASAAALFLGVVTLVVFATHNV
jgi:hypothetical protein